MTEGGSAARWRFCARAARFEADRIGPREPGDVMACKLATQMK